MWFEGGWGNSTFPFGLEDILEVPFQGDSSVVAFSDEGRGAISKFTVAVRYLVEEDSAEETRFTKAESLHKSESVFGTESLVGKVFRLSLLF